MIINGILRTIFTLSLILILKPALARADLFEFGGTFSFSQSHYGENNSSWVRRWGASVGYFFWESSQIEFSMQDILYRNKFEGVEDSTFHDQVYSVDWVQHFGPKDFFIQPYVKAGLGKLDRNASGSHWEGGPTRSYSTLTGVVGGGVRVQLVGGFGLRFEGTSYLSSPTDWKDNFSFNAGFSFYL